MSAEEMIGSTDRSHCVYNKDSIGNEMPSGSASVMTSPQVYAKDSMDRFGDDLCEELLSYLALDDRFRCECVAKQWQRVVYKTVIEVSINCNFKIGNKSIVKYFDSILEKCENISRLKSTADLTDSQMESIIRHCHRLADIDLCLNSGQNGDTFFAKFAQQLKTLTINWTVERSAKRCPNVTKICGRYGLALSSLRPLLTAGLFPRLRSLEFKYDTENGHWFADRFVADYKHAIKCVDIEIDDSVCADTTSLMNGLAQMSALIDLRIRFTHSDDPYVKLNVRQLREVGVNCPQIKSLEITGIEEHMNYRKIMSAIGQHFPRLTRLSMSGYFYAELSNEILIACKRVERLRISSADRVVVRESFVGHLPRLHSLYVSDVTVTDSVLDIIAKVSKLRSIELYGDEEYTEAGLAAAIKKWPKIMTFSVNDTNVLADNHSSDPLVSSDTDEDAVNEDLIWRPE